MSVRGTPKILSAEMFTSLVYKSALNSSLEFIVLDCHRLYFRILIKRQICFKKIIYLNY